MITTLLFTRKIDKESYKFILNSPSHDGEKGVLGIEYKPYLSIETPENCFGYPDIILFSHGKPCTVSRYLPAWKLKRIQEIVTKNNLTNYTN